jgi:hypothetical protein
LETLTIPLDEAITLRHAEQVVLKLSESTFPSWRVHLDLSRCKHIELGAGQLLANALRPYGQDSLLEVIVPSRKTADDFSSFWFLNFTRSGLGHALATYASSIYSADGKDITNFVRSYYQESFRPLSNNLLLITGLDRRVTIDVNSFDSFLAQFREWLPRVNANAAGLRQDDIENTGQVCFESIQNVFDHASRSPLPMGTKILSCFAIRYYKKLTPPLEGSPSVRRYWKQLRSLLADNEHYPGFIELVVNDDGVGVAARQMQDLKVYWASQELEMKALQLAFAPGGSVKLVTKDAPIRGDPGYGLTMLVSAIRNLKALGVLRTGRCLATLDGTSLNPEGFELEPHSLGCLPGTFLQVIVPLPAQPKPPKPQKRPRQEHLGL